MKKLEFILGGWKKTIHRTKAIDEKVGFILGGWKLTIHRTKADGKTGQDFTTKPKHKNVSKCMWKLITWETLISKDDFLIQKHIYLLILISKDDFLIQKHIFLLILISKNDFLI